MSTFVADRLTFGQLDGLRRRLDIPRESFVKVLGMSVRTYERRGLDATQKTGRDVADRALRLARVHALAEEVMGGEASARVWLASRQPGLGGRLPNDLLISEFGAREVEDMLHRIDAGVYV